MITIINVTYIHLQYTVIMHVAIDPNLHILSSELLRIPVQSVSEAIQSPQNSGVAAGEERVFG